MTWNSSIGYLGVGKQSVKATSVASSKWLKCFDLDMKPVHKAIDLKPELTTATRQAKTDLLAGPIHWTGTAKAYVRPETLPLLILGAGFADTKTGAGPEYTHTLDPAAALPWLTLHTGLGGNLFRKYTDVVVDKVVLKAVKDNIAVVELTFIAIREDIETTDTVTEETAPLLTFTDAVVTFDGGATTPFESVDIEWANKCSTNEYVLGSRYLNDITPSRPDLGFKGTIKFSDITIYKKAVYGSASATAVGNTMYECTNTSLKFTSATIIGGSAVPYSFEVKIARMTLTELNPPMGDDKPIWVDFKAEPLKASGSSIMQFIFVNSIATAY